MHLSALEWSALHIWLTGHFFGATCEPHLSHMYAGYCMENVSVYRHWCVMLASNIDIQLHLLLQRLQGEVFLFMDMCGSLLATLRL